MFQFLLHLSWPQEFVSFPLTFSRWYLENVTNARLQCSVRIILSCLFIWWVFLQNCHLPLRLVTYLRTLFKHSFSFIFYWEVTAVLQHCLKCYPFTSSGLSGLRVWHFPKIQFIFDSIRKQLKIFEKFYCNNSSKKMRISQLLEKK